MKTKLKLLTVAMMLFLWATNFAQDSISGNNYEIQRETKKIKVRPIRLGAKLGFPNVIGGNLEYVTPILKHKVAANADYSSISGSWFSGGDGLSNVDLKFSYIEGGLNYYIFKPGKGIYAGLNYGNLKFKGSEEYQSTDEEETQTGRVSYDFTHSSANLKVGAKLGGLFYFRPEVGYSLGSAPKSYDRTIVYNDGSRDIEKINFSSDDSVVDASILFSGLIFNIGMGFAF